MAAIRAGSVHNCHKIFITKDPCEIFSAKVRRRRCVLCCNQRGWWASGAVYTCSFKATTYPSAVCASLCLQNPSGVVTEPMFPRLRLNDWQLLQELSLLPAARRSWQIDDDNLLKSKGRVIQSSLCSESM